MLNRTTIKPTIPSLFTITKLIFLIILIRPTVDLWVNLSLIPGAKYAIINIAAISSFLVLLAYFYSQVKQSLVPLSGKRISAPLAIPFFVFIVYSVIVSTLMSGNKLLAGADCLRLLTILTFYILCYKYVDSEKKARKFVTVFLWSSIIPIAVGLSQLYTGDSAKLFFRIRGTFVNPNAFGQYLALVSIFAIVFMLYTNRNKQLLLLFIVFSVFSLIMTLTRSAWIGFFVGIIVLLLITKRSSKRLSIFFLMAILIFTVITSLPTFDNLLVNTMDLENVEVSSVASRLLLWGDILSRIYQNPFLGIGLKQSYFLLNVEPHNDYLRLLLELGVIGFTLFLWIGFLMVRFAYKIIKYTVPNSFINTLAIAFFCLCTVYLIMSFSDNLLTSLVIQFPIWGLAAILHRNALKTMIR